jgi:hypothetical protein
MSHELSPEHQAQVVEWLGRGETPGSCWYLVEAQNRYGTGLSPWPDWLSKEAIQTIRNEYSQDIAMATSDWLSSHLVTGLVKREMLAAHLADITLSVSHVAAGILKQIEDLMAGGALAIDAEMLKPDPSGETVVAFEGEVVSRDGTPVPPHGGVPPGIAEKRALGLDPTKVYLADLIFERVRHLVLMYRAIAEDRNTVTKQLEALGDTSRSYTERMAVAAKIVNAFSARGQSYDDPAAAAS